MLSKIKSASSWSWRLTFSCLLDVNTVFLWLSHQYLTMSYVGSTVPVTMKTVQSSTWPFRRCSRPMPVEHSLASTNLTWRLISQWNSAVWRHSCRHQTCLSRKQHPCQFYTTILFHYIICLQNFWEFQSTVTNFAVQTDLATCGIYSKLHCLFRLIWWEWWFLNSRSSIHHPDSAQRPSASGPDRKLSAKQSRDLFFMRYTVPSYFFFYAFDYSKITDTLVESVRRCWRSTKIIFKSLSHFQSKIWSL